MRKTGILPVDKAAYSARPGAMEDTSPWPGRIKMAAYTTARKSSEVRSSHMNTRLKVEHKPRGDVAYGYSCLYRCDRVI